ncbi:MAG: pyridoxamine 5'-phosphate oxidase family protein [Rhodospirillaceae bacterium]|jgi:uncharacterized protein|nr:pyridoxamine 5'-phosphate oxidase family protein [Rhodospirillaceae bacterium]MBT7957359.1 pyridoxamine 5'-phosphate oxidase family protein [Rhodospirillaceae bacterium]
MPDSTITDVQGLREIYDEPRGRPVEKLQTKIDAESRRYIAASPFLILGTSKDVSPRGDHPGFVQVLDDNTLLLPDRRGNNLIDSFQNIVEDPTVSLIFLIPGISETLRIRGEAKIITDPELLEPLAVNGKVPTTGLKIHVNEALMHCAKAILRAKLWDAETQLDRKEFAATKIIAAHTSSEYEELHNNYEKGVADAMAEEGRE